MKELKLHLGCGDVLLDGYLNIDNFNPKADLVFDLCRRLPFKDNSVAEIKAIHVIEHFSREEWKTIAPDWYRVLKPGGRMFLATPNLETLCRMFVDGRGEAVHYAYVSIYGSQEHAGQYHKQGFTHKSLKASFPKMQIELNHPEDTEIRADLVK